MSPYANKEKQKAYLREYAKKDRNLIKKKKEKLDEENVEFHLELYLVTHGSTSYRQMRERVIEKLNEIKELKYYEIGVEA